MKKFQGFLLILILIFLISGCAPKPQNNLPPQNNPPNIPQDPFPPNGAQGVTITPILSWSCTDLDGDALVYDIYFGKNQNSLLKIKENHNTNSHQIFNLEYNTTYYWKVVAKDEKGGVTEGPVWRFTTQSESQTNNPPNTPSNPNPTNGAQNVPTSSPILSWECSDPDNDTLVFDIYFGTNPNNMTLIKSNHTYSSYQLSTLQYNITYYWKIVAKDVKGGVTEGPVWRFTTTQSGDVAKAKALISDLRNTILTIHDYKGIGVPGIVDTPFQRLSEEIQEKIVPDLTETVKRVVFIVNCTSQISEPGTYFFTYTGLNYNLIITIPQSQTSSLSFTFEGYSENKKIDEGNLVVQFNNKNQPESGNLNATMKTNDGNIVISGNFSATFLSNTGFIDTLTIKGNITSSYLNIDFSQVGLYVDFGEWYDEPNQIYLNYLEKITIGGKITTTTAQAEGNLDIDAKLVELPDYYTNNPPTNVSFTGTFREIKNGSPTGAYFTGTISAQYLNPDGYNPYAPYGPNNYPQWQASFHGHIEAPKRPKIDANLSIVHDTYQLYKIQVGYERTNPDGSKVWLKTPQTSQSYYHEGTKTMEVYMVNQDSLTLYFKVDGNKTGDDVFSGNIKNNIGAILAELYLQSGIPMVRYSDGYIESIF